MSSDNSFTLKVSHGNELRRVSLASPSSSTFSSVCGTVAQLFPTLQPQNSGGAFLLRWVDDDGDVITIAADEDVREAIDYSRKAGRDVLKVIVVVKETDKVR